MADDCFYSMIFIFYCMVFEETEFSKLDTIKRTHIFLRRIA